MTDSGKPSLIEALEEIKVSVCSFASFYSWLADHGYWGKFALPHAESVAEDRRPRRID